MDNKMTLRDEIAEAMWKHECMDENADYEKDAFDHTKLIYRSYASVAIDIFIKHIQSDEVEVEVHKALLAFIDFGDHMAASEAIEAITNTIKEETVAEIAKRNNFKELPKDIVKQTIDTQ